MSSPQDNAAGSGRSDDVVSRLTSERDRAAVVETFVDAFYDDPVHAWVFEDESRRRSQLSVWFDAMIRHAPAESHVDMLTGAAGFWQPPKVNPLHPAAPAASQFDDAEVDDAAGDGWLISFLCAELGDETAWAKLGQLAQVPAAHPTDPHWYLAVLGTAGIGQGRGLGSQLLRTQLADCDATGAATYLESSNPRNIGLYERHGFVVTGEIRLGEDGPTLTTMWRDAVPTASPTRQAE